MLHYKLNTHPSETTTIISVANGLIASGSTLFLSEDYTVFSGQTTENVIGLGNNQPVIVSHGVARAGATIQYNPQNYEFILTLDQKEAPINIKSIVVARQTRYLIYDNETKVQVMEKTSTNYVVNLPGQPEYYVNINGDIINILIRTDDLGTEYAVIDGITYPIVFDTEESVSGTLLKLYTENEILTLGETLRLYAPGLLDNKYIIQPGQQYVFIIDSWYPIEANMAYECTISGNTIELEQDSTTPTLYRSKKDPAFTFTEAGGVLTYLTASGNTTITATTQLNTYSGVTYEEVDYIIRPELIALVDGTTKTKDVVNIPTSLLANLKVTEIESPNCYVLTPDSLIDDAAYGYVINKFKDITNYISQHATELRLVHNNTILGQPRLSYGENIQNLINDVAIIIPASGYELPLLFSNENPLNLNQEYRLNNDYEKKIEDELLETKRHAIIDMDYDMYCPGFFPDKNKYNDEVPSNFHDVNEIRFNLHFRTRDLETGQVIEDDKNPYTHNKCNWFVTDYYDPKSLTKKGPNPQTDYKKLCKDLINNGDLLGFIGFADDDIRYQKERLAKSFVRLSFYDSNDYTKQSLLYHTTIFMNEGECYGKYMNNNNSNSSFITVDRKLSGSVDANLCNNIDFVDFFGIDDNTICSFEGASGNTIDVKVYRNNYSHNIMLDAQAGDMVVIGNTTTNVGYYEIISLLNSNPFNPPTEYVYRLKLLCAGISHSDFYKQKPLFVKTSYAPIRVVRELNQRAGALTEKVNTCPISYSVRYPVQKTYTIPSTLVFDKDRISTQLKSFKNTEHNKCSDGFYLHLFKEYANRYHKRTIYMKVEFNNAANGTTSQFMLLKNSQGQMVSSFEEITDEIKEGYDTRVMYKHVFIPIQVIYDKVKQRYTYYFEDNDSDVLNFNLFEVKYRFGKIIPGGGKNREMIEITAKPNNDSIGKCSGSGYYLSGDTVTLTAEVAINNACWMGWDDLDDSDPDKFATARTIVVGDQDTTYIANFEKYYQVHIHTNDIFSGTTLLEKTGDIALNIEVDSTTTLSGTTAGAFTYHDDLTGVTIDRNEITTTRHMVPDYPYASGVTLTGFYLCPDTTQQPAHTMTVGAIHTIQCFDSNLYVRATDKLIVKTTPHKYYSLTGLTLNGQIIQPVSGTTDTFEISVTGDSEIICGFDKATAHVTVNVNNTEMGEAYATTGATSPHFLEFDVPVYTPVTFTATPISGVSSTFLNWSGDTTATASTFNTTITGDTNITAVFSAATALVTFTMYGSDTGVTLDDSDSMYDGKTVFIPHPMQVLHPYISGTTQTFTVNTSPQHELQQYSITTNNPLVRPITGTTSPFSFPIIESRITISTVIKQKMYHLTALSTIPDTTVYCIVNFNGTTYGTYNNPNNVPIPAGAVIIRLEVLNVDTSTILPIWSDGNIGIQHPQFTMNNDYNLTVQ